ncbi:cation:proton antiporter [Candidatus Woesearchaeota archaeon]|nr:cation:proton antiporter [Candidatus Woesearchaeota archaeon]
MAESFILVLALLILLAKILGEISEKIGLTSLVGEVFAGILLGPQILDILGYPEIFHSLADIGIILLLFLAGFEHGSIKDLLKYKKTSMMISLLSSSLPIIAVVIYALTQGFSLLTSLFLAVALGATSMGASLRSLMSVNEIDSRTGKTVMGSLVLNDITGLILLTGVVSYAEITTGGGGNIFFQIGKVIASVGIFFALFYISFMYVPKLTRKFAKFRVEEAQFSLAIVIILMFAWAATYFGLSSIIGAFFAGIILSRSPIFENHTFVEKVSSLSYGFFVPIFFAFTGSQLSFQGFAANITRALIFMVLITTVQVGCAYIAAKLNKYNNKEGLLIGLGMLPYGEVTLVVMSALVALSNKKADFFIGEDILGLFSSVLLLIIISILLTPLLMRFVVHVFKEKPSEE